MVAGGIEQELLVVAADRPKPGQGQEFETPRGEGSSVDQVTQRPDQVTRRIEAGQIQESFQRMGHTVQVTEHEDTARMSTEIVTFDSRHGYRGCQVADGLEIIGARME